jgi:hypothetical protein
VARHDRRARRITSAVTHAIAGHGVYAVFGMMALDAVLALGSELIMVYAGVLAAGAAGGAYVTVFGGRRGYSEGL